MKLAAAILPAALLAGPALAAAGAIAYDADAGAFGSAWGAQDRDAAAVAAVADCRAYGAACAPVLSFADACGALARGRAAAHAAKAGATVGEAEAAALAACRGLDAAGCEIVVSFCSDN